MNNCSQVRKKRERKEVREGRGEKAKEQAQSSGWVDKDGPVK